MISQNTILEVRAKMDTREVLELLGVTFKKDVACCPFHAEKTGSFRVWEKTNKYKCFGCGESGDAISAVMKLKNMGFSESVEFLAGHYSVNVEFEKISKEETEEKRSERQKQFEVVAFAHKRFQDCLMSMPADSEAWQYLESRGYSRELAQEWSLGLAPDDGKFLTTPIINSGHFQPALDCGIIATKDGRNYDYFRNRIMIPIHNGSGILCGFGGRLIGHGQPKYMNSANSLIYQKEAIWFGIDRAAKAIKEEGFAYVVEGYFDVMSWQNADAVNTVAACGTAITEAHVKHLKRYTDHVVIAQDGDAAGYKATLKAIDLFLAADFKVEVIDLPDGKDPDEFVSFYMQNQ